MAAGPSPLVAVEAGHTCPMPPGRMHESDFEEVDGELGRRGQLGLVIRESPYAGGMADGLARHSGGPSRGNCGSMVRWRASRARIAAMTPEQRAAMGADGLGAGRLGRPAGVRLDEPAWTFEAGVDMPWLLSTRSYTLQLRNEAQPRTLGKEGRRR